MPEHAFSRPSHKFTGPGNTRTSPHSPSRAKPKAQEPIPPRKANAAGEQSKGKHASSGTQEGLKFFTDKQRLVAACWSSRVACWPPYVIGIPLFCLYPFNAHPPRPRAPNFLKFRQRILAKKRGHLKYLPLPQIAPSLTFPLPPSIIPPL